MDMQAKIEKLEFKVSELTFEIKNLVKTQQDISEILKEFRDITTTTALLNKDVVALKSDINRLFVKVSAQGDSLHKLEKTDTVQSLKIGGAERIGWAIITAGVAILVGYFKGKS